MKKTIKVLFSFLCAWWLWSTVALPCQAQMITIGILPFQDESGANVPPALLQKICQEFKLKMTLAYKDVLARLVSAESLGAPANAGIEQLAAFGKQQGVKFVLRGGILAVVSEKVGNDLKCQLELFSELIDTDSSIVSSLRAEGEGLETNSATDDARRWESYNWNSPGFAQAALGQALNAALGNLADQVHASAVTPAAPPPGQTQPPVETAATATQTQPPPAAAPAADPYQMDQELQQLIAQAESLLSSGSAANMGDITPLQQSLEGLKTAMNNKLNLMQQAQDTTAVDQEILQRKQDLQNLVSAYTQQAASAPPPSADAQQFSGEKKDLISKINDLLGNTLNTILKIQEMRTALSSSNQAQGAVPPQPTDAGTGQPPVDTSAGQQPPPPTEEQTSSVSGVVTDNGNPVEGATVTDPQSGASATTDSNGSYTIAHLPSGRIANLQVVKDGLQIATGKVESPARPIRHFRLDAQTRIHRAQLIGQPDHALQHDCRGKYRAGQREYHPGSGARWPRSTGPPGPGIGQRSRHGAHRFPRPLYLRQHSPGQLPGRRATGRSRRPDPAGKRGGRPSGADADALQSQKSLCRDAAAHANTDSGREHHPEGPGG